MDENIQCIDCQCNPLCWQ